MALIFSDTKQRELKVKETIGFTVRTKGLFLLQISARTKSEKQLGGTDDEDLRLEIDGKKFPLLTNSERYSDSPAAFSGGASKGFKKTIFFITWLETGKHIISLIPDIAAIFISLDVTHISQNSILKELPILVNNLAEDGDRRDWITFVLVNASFVSIATELILQRRFLDSDDVKIIIDGTVKQNHQNKRQKLWYFITSFFKGEKQNGTFNVDLPTGMHYVEFWADRTPKLEKVTFSNIGFKIPTTIQEKIEYQAKQYGFDPKMMLRLAKRESQFDPRAISNASAKGLFQLTEITIKQIKELGFEITDPYDIDQNIEGGFVYFNWLYRRYKGQKDQIKKTLAAWNWGLVHIPIREELDFEGLPDGVEKFINDVLGDYDF